MSFVDAAMRRGIYDGLILSALSAVGIVLTNVVFPAGPDESDSDPEYLIQSAALLAVMSILFVVIGVRARRRRDALAAGARAGAAAGVVLAVMVTLTFLVMNNLFLGIVSQQHDKRLSFAASGWTSMRAYLTVQQLEGALILVPIAAIGGAVLGLVGAAVAARTARPPSGTALTGPASMS
jgi:uncharacterized membrane protein YozB (DUF420 family)